MRHLTLLVSALIGLSAVSASAHTPCDFNANGLVDQADLDLVLTSWGKPFDEIPPTWVCAMPTEGIVDQEELDEVLANWGGTQPGLGTAAGVPEPTTVALLLVCGLLSAPRLCRRLRAQPTGRDVD